MLGTSSFGFSVPTSYALVISLMIWFELGYISI